MRTRQRSILTAIAVLAAVALAGAIIGAFADRSLRAAPAADDAAERVGAECPAPHEGRGQRGMRTRLIDRLDLTAEQQERLDRVLEERHDEVKAIRRQSGARMDSVVAETRRQIAEILTEEQAEQLRQMRQERRQRGTTGETRGTAPSYGGPEPTSSSPERNEYR